MSFRKEKKYRLFRSDMAKIKMDLISLGMQELHPSRQVNSCYFDTSELILYYESEEGVLPRKKIRIRWYDDVAKFNKEIKISSLEGRFKKTEVAGSLLTVNDLHRTICFDKDYGSLSPVLQVRYVREYFFYKSLRITFDSDISYEFLRSATNASRRDPECVMEVKVPIDCDDSYVEGLINFPTSRFSKYSRGLLFFDGML